MTDVGDTSATAVSARRDAEKAPGRPAAMSSLRDGPDVAARIGCALVASRGLADGRWLEAGARWPRMTLTAQREMVRTRDVVTVVAERGGTRHEYEIAVAVLVR